MSSEYEIDVMETYVPEEVVVEAHENLLLNQFPRILENVAAVLQTLAEWQVVSPNKYQRVDGNLIVTLTLDLDNGLLRAASQVTGAEPATERYNALVSEVIDLACQRSVQQAAEVMHLVGVAQRRVVQEPPVYSQQTQTTQVRIKVYAF